ncbi:unnamed protein product [Fusarium graminearum]|uniref:Uncharacterized protein n=1 Tax=Gibberella zeae TaxID=5518 RepID=A0A4U9ERL7_GIBZA|nr:hypothetical protein HG531_007051 [Fusarium graminearum]CAF3614920.1 unnamed protein product [Fusarium graminearum]CAF3626961.1 unnamed protein product [Fusarium graminearum]CAF3639864.1 unnamed protein product [Fusarium graminearum]CAG1965710.1 unnamed protein product [Fusarium graminearum]
MTTKTAAEADKPTMLQRYLFNDGQSRAQGRLASAIPAPTVVDKTAEMRKHLESLGHGPKAANEEQQSNKMIRELERLERGS